MVFPPARLLRPEPSIDGEEDADDTTEGEGEGECVVDFLARGLLKGFVVPRVSNSFKYFGAWTVRLTGKKSFSFCDIFDKVFFPVEVHNTTGAVSLAFGFLEACDAKHPLRNSNFHPPVIQAESENRRRRSARRRRRRCALVGVVSAASALLVLLLLLSFALLGRRF